MIGKLFISEEGVIVTAVLETLLTVPVTSSMRSSWPEARFEFATGRLKAVVTGRVPELERFRVRVEPLTVREFARLTSMPIPVLLVTD